MLDWDKLRIFHTAAESGSFTHAAEKLGMSQSAVSRQISALEDDLRLKLFIRHARGLVLTEVGEQLFRTAHRMHWELQQVETQAPGHRLVALATDPLAGGDGLAQGQAQVVKR